MFGYRKGEDDIEKNKIAWGRKPPKMNKKIKPQKNSPPLAERRKNV